VVPVINVPRGTSKDRYACEIFFGAPKGAHGMFEDILSVRRAVRFKASLDHVLRKPKVP